MTDLEYKVLEYSFKHHWGHIPSALTQVEYISRLIKILPDHLRVAGKPFGAQAWYVALGVDSDEPLLQPPYVHWNCQTIGHALGYSLGLSYHQNVWLNLSDASLELGDFWESLSLWRRFNRHNLLVTVDCNGYGCKHKTTDINDTKKRIESFDVPCSIVKPDEVAPYNGILLVDTTDTLGAELKELGFHYTKFKDFEDFCEKCGRSLASRS